MLGQEHRRRRAAGEPALDLAALGRPARQLADEVAAGDAQLDLVVAGPLDVARDRDDLRAGGLLGAERLEPVGALLDDQRDVAERLDVVDQRRPLVEALVRGERGLQARVAALALERVEQRRLLAADVGALAAVHPQLEREVRAEDALADVALLPSPPRPPSRGSSACSSYSPRMKMNARFAPAARAAMMIPSIRRCGFFCISRRSLNVPGSDSSALQQRNLSIEPLGMKLAFLPIAKPAPPRPRRPELLELVDQLPLVHLDQALAQARVAAEPLVDVDPGEARLVDVLEQDARLFSHRRGPFRAAAARRASAPRRSARRHPAGAARRSGRSPTPSAPCRRRRGTRTRGC